MANMAHGHGHTTPRCHECGVTCESSLRECGNRRRNDKEIDLSPMRISKILNIKNDYLSTRHIMGLYDTRAKIIYLFTRILYPKTFH